MRLTGTLRWFSLSALLAAALSLVSVSRAAIVTGPAAAGLIHPETDLFRIAVDPARGARVSSLVYKPVGKETVFSGGGFCLDHFWEQSWPGEFLGAV